MKKDTFFWTKNLKRKRCRKKTQKKKHNSKRVVKQLERKSCSHCDFAGFFFRGNITQKVQNFCLVFEMQTNPLMRLALNEKFFRPFGSLVILCVCVFFENLQFYLTHFFSQMLWEIWLSRIVKVLNFTSLIIPTSEITRKTNRKSRPCCERSFNYMDNIFGQKASLICYFFFISVFLIYVIW